MRIGIITNLPDIEEFTANHLAFASANQWMEATGGNTGNVAFVQGVKNVITKENVGTIHWSDDPSKVKANYDLIVICCANQIGAHVDLQGWVNVLVKFDLPTLFIGLGAQSDAIGTYPEIPEGSKRLLALSKSLRVNGNTPNIITRGPFTSEVLQANGIDSSPFGCPSQFISTQLKVGQKCLEHQNSARETRVLTAGGNPWHASHQLEKLLTEITDLYNGMYVVQHPEGLVKLALNELSYINEDVRFLFSRVYKSLGNWQDIASWFKQKSILFGDAQNWMFFAKRYSLALGPRYHGVALPIQANVPGKVIAIDSRTEELAKTTGIPCIHYTDAEKMTAQALVEKCKWNQHDADEFDRIRQKNAAQYISFFKANGVKHDSNLEMLANKK